MNTASVRQALNEKELSWLENLQPIAPNNLTTVPGPLGAITTISETITSQFYANVSGLDWIVSFSSVGSGWVTHIGDSRSTRFAPPGTFTSPDATVWQGQQLLINDPTAGYCLWNNLGNIQIFVRQGGVSPVITLTNGGSGYTSVPAVAINGGSGMGATAVATIGTPQVTAVNVITGGTQYGPAPGVVFSGGGGSGAAATANIDPRSIQSVTVVSPGQYFAGTPSPTVTVTGGGGSGASLVCGGLLFNGAIFYVSIIGINNPGSGYTSAPTVTISGGSVFPGHDATAICTVGDGRVLSVTVTNGGGGYTSAPAVSFTGGGSGSGATAASTVGGTSVTSIALTNPGAGYLASDTLTVAFSGGGGSGAAATAHVWPFVTGGPTLAVFDGRVWLGHGHIVQYTGTGGFDDFSAAGASAFFSINDNDLVHAVTALRNFNNYLFIMGDQSVKQIGNISLNNAGNVTLFTVLTLSSDQGTIYPLSCGSFNRIFMFANSNGIYAVLGASVQKISDDLDGIFRINPTTGQSLIDFSQPIQAAIADINGIHHIAFLVRYKDPLASTRSILLVFNGKRWFVVSQGNALVTVVTASDLTSGKTVTYASSGSDITVILGEPRNPVTFKAQTALTHHGNAVQRKQMLAAGTALTTTGSGSVTVNFDTENGTVAKAYTLATGFQLPSGHSGVGGSGRYLGMTITGTLAGFTLNNAELEYIETALWS